MGELAAVDRLRRAVSSDGAPSARNLIVTVFGDALLPHGPGTEIAVSSLARLLGPFGVNERLVRTSLTRLTNDDILTARAQGRRSFYRVAPTAVEVFERADRRIYGTLDRDWDGRWTIAIVDAGESRAEVRDALAAIGLGSIAPNVLASPVVSVDDAVREVASIGPGANVVVVRSVLAPGPGLTTDRDLARRALDLDEIEGRYRDVVAALAPYTELDELDPELAFKLRTLVVATYRRVVLADPVLPAGLLPDEWVGRRARRLAAELYAMVADRSEDYLDGVVPRRDVRNRFV